MALKLLILDHISLHTGGSRRPCYQPAAHPCLEFDLSYPTSQSAKPKVSQKSVTSFERSCLCCGFIASADSLVQSHASRIRLASERSGKKLQCHATGGSSIGDAGESSEEPGEVNEIADARRRLAQSFQNPSSRITGKQLRELVIAKYGRSYDVRLAKINNRVYIQIMWRHLEQRSFPLTEAMYMDQLDAVAEFLNIWGVVDKVCDMIMKTKHRPGYTGGGGAKAVSLPLDIGRGAGRGQEWMDHF